MEFDLSSLVDPSLDPEAQKLRLTLWAIVNWLLPIRLHPAAEGGFDYYALKHQLLPRAPVAGDRVLLPDSWAQVTRAQWDDQGRFAAVIQAVTRKTDYLDQLQQAGWETFPSQDTDEWLQKSFVMMGSEPETIALNLTCAECGRSPRTGETWRIYFADRVLVRLIYCPECAEREFSPDAPRSDGG